MRHREDKLDLLELLLKRPALGLGPLPVEDLKELLPDLYRSGRFSEVCSDLSSPTVHGYVLAGCYVIKDGRHKLGLRINDREQAHELVQELKAWPEKSRRRGRPSALAV